MKRENKKRTSRFCIGSSLALLKHLIRYLREIIAVCSFYYNYFLTVSINRLQEFVYENKQLEKPNWRANHTII